ncbi:hypothetical protein [Lentibacillus saliphilus]|uniref:hypothetical protein n=1 Tax=Lentibacillus saliphilus TaxID=2737028 RepID=UPI001C30F87D|nr:hypothetical protein [Lentibacillus saliphilus]
MNERLMRDSKITQLKRGQSVYAESQEMIRLIKRGISKHQLSVHYDHTASGCWFIPIPEKQSG